jgi:hypothetical protein
MTPEETAAEWAAGQVARVRDDPSARMALLVDTYRGAVGATARPTLTDMCGARRQNLRGAGPKRHHVRTWVEMTPPFLDSRPRRRSSP